MDSKVITPIERIKECIGKGNHFVLQGGAGSGKTETLKQTLSFISEKYPTKKVACITHTNLAVDEIKSRVEGEYTISTIHSFLNNIIKPFKKNLHQELHHLFSLPPLVAGNIDDFDDKKAFRKDEHDKYKETYKKLGKKLFSLNKESLPKEIGKVAYDKDPVKYNSELNENILRFNKYVADEISKRSWHGVRYNDTPYDNLSKLSFGHDGLIEIAYLLFNKYPLLSKILQDKFDYVFVDEFQDTHPHIVKIFLEILPKNNIVIGLFGDSMQGIYEDGVGTVEPYIVDATLIKISKKDNFRCSHQIVDFLNHIRVPIDGLKQDVALKKIDGELELEGKRQGNVAIYYSIYKNPKPNSRSEPELKSAYLDSIMGSLCKIEEGNVGYKKLMLTNKAIAANLGFSDIFNLFNDRYSEVNTEIEDFLAELGLLGLAEICIDFKGGRQKLLISKLKKSGFVINKFHDKTRASKLLNAIANTNCGLIRVLEFALKHKLVNSHESYDSYVEYKNMFLNELSSDSKYQMFKAAYFNGENSFSKFIQCHPDFFDSDMQHTGLEASYHHLLSRLKKERFYIELFSNDVSFKNVMVFHDYINENAEFITMHKTKGTGIANVLVVLDDFFWSKYQFNSLFDIGSSTPKMKSKIEKIFYVACSRAKSNLICFKLISQDEEASFKSYFPRNMELKKINL